MPPIRRTYKNYYSIDSEEVLTKKERDEKELFEHFSSNSNEPKSAQIIYEVKRASRQMGHYYDTAKYKLEAPQASTDCSDPKVVPTKAQIQYWKLKSEEKKKKRSAWLYE